MGSEWAHTTLAEELHFANGKSSPERQDQFPYPVYGSNGVIGFAKKTNAESNTLIIGRVGSYCGSVYISRKRCWVTDNAMKANCRGLNNPAFFYYLLKNLNLNRWRGGSGQPLLNQQILGSLSIHLPNSSEQHAIAHVLGSLDDKIELNRKMNATLEAMAQALFKSWFVDFDPVIDNALAAGNPIPEEFQARAAARESLGDARKPLPDDLQNLFPDSFRHTEELGWIPQGWEVGPIKRCCSKVQNGGTPKRNVIGYWEPQQIPWLTSGEVRQGFISQTQFFISELGLKKSAAKWVPEDSTVVALYGATAGQVAFCAEELTTNQAVCALIPKNDYRFFNYCQLSNSIGALANQARGSAQQNISKGIVEELPVVLPTEEIIQTFDVLCSPIFKKWKASEIQSIDLAKCRDALLPKLLAGELRLPLEKIDLPVAV